MRAQRSGGGYGKGAGTTRRTRDVLRDFWTEGIERNEDYENIVTLGMRGDGDEPMSESGQRRAAREDRGRPAADPRRAAQPRRRPPCRRSGRSTRRSRTTTNAACACRTTSRCSGATTTGATSAACRPPRSASARGGAGIYYHFDYVGGPRNYKWLNITPIAEGLGADEPGLSTTAPTGIWIVNVGDIKPMEFPIEFFLDYAWDPARWPAERLPEYARLWAEREFGPEHAARDRRDRHASTRSFNSRRRSPRCSSPTPTASSTTARPRPSSPSTAQLEERAEAICASASRRRPRTPSSSSCSIRSRPAPC